MTYAETILKLPKLDVRETSEAMLITPAQTYEEMRLTADMAQESFHVITVDAKNRMIGKHMIGLGTLNSTLVHPREVFRVAINDSAAAIILSHNHPSGDPTPSSEDIKVTKQLVQAGEIMGIRVVDHVIIGRKRSECTTAFLSIREAGLVQF